MVNSGWGTMEVLPDKVKLRWTAKLDIPVANGPKTRDPKLTEKIESMTKKCWEELKELIKKTFRDLASQPKPEMLRLLTPTDQVMVGKNIQERARRK